MFKAAFAFCCLLLALPPHLGLAAAELPPQPPKFSWDTVPVFMHSGNA